MYLLIRSSGQVNEEEMQTKNSAKDLIIDETTDISTSSKMANSTAP